MMIKDLKAQSPVDEIELTVLEKGESRTFTSRYGSSGKVCDTRAADSDGDQVTLTLWNEEVEQVNVSDKVRIKDGWVKEWQGSLQVSSGRRGQLEVL